MNSGGGGSAPVVRDTYLQWTDTGIEEATQASGESGNAARNAAEIDLKRQASDEKPSLVYWVWSDESDKRGKETRKADRNVWDNEKVARAARLFHCYRVDAKEVPPQRLQMLGVRAVPFVQVVGKDRLAVASSEPNNASSMESFLRASAQRFPEYWASVVRRMKELERKLDEGKAAMKKKDYDAAVSAFTEVYNDDVRSDLLDKARDLLAQARKKAEKEASRK